MVGSKYWWHFELVKMLPVLGSVVVLLGSYFAARTLRDNELAKATEMLGDEALAVRIAGIHQLGSIGMSVPRFRKYAQLTLYAFVEETGESKDVKARDFAKNVLEQLRQPKGAKVAALSVKVGDFFSEANPTSGTGGSGAAPGS